MEVKKAISQEDIRRGDPPRGGGGGRYSRGGDEYGRGPYDSYGRHRDYPPVQAGTCVCVCVCVCACVCVCVVLRGRITLLQHEYCINCDFPRCGEYLEGRIMKHTENSSNSLFLDRNGNSTNQFLSISITTSTGE